MQIALQGPLAQQLLERLTGKACIPVKYYTAVFEAKIADIPCVISRTGYTGEDGVEILVRNEFSEYLWDKLLEAGKEYGIKPIGLGARDTLRLEAALHLYGNDLDSNVYKYEIK